MQRLMPSHVDIGRIGNEKRVGRPIRKSDAARDTSDAHCSYRSINIRRSDIGAGERRPHNPGKQGRASENRNAPSGRVAEGRHARASPPHPLATTLLEGIATEERLCHDMNRSVLCMRIQHS